MPPPRLFRRIATTLAISVLAGAGAPASHAKPPDEPDFAAQHAAAKRTFEKEVTPFLRAYCIKCHGPRPKAGINFLPTLKDPGNAAFRQWWKQAFAIVNTHDMPPDDAERQPTDAERQMFLDWIGQSKFLSPKDPGTFVLRRLTKLEYGNTLRDLFGVDPAITRDLPDEVVGQGYLNSLSPLQSEQYLGIANAVVEQIVAPDGAPPTAMQRRWFGEPPPVGVDSRPAAQAVARRLARSAYRRPATEAEIEVLGEVYELGRQSQLSHSGALGLMLKAVLVSPQFLYITPFGEPPPGRTIVPLDPHQLASRLSYLLWATLPDAELDALAERGQLQEPSILRAQVRRMLADPRARALFDGFGAQWLGLGELAGKVFDPEKFPAMTAEVRAAMYDEARLYFESVVRENQRVARFIDGDYTFVNGPLAPFYGLERSITGPAMRRVQLADGNRGGILGMPGILATTSFPNRTSAVKRGIWVLEQILGEHVPPAPPNVPPLENATAAGTAGLTLRQRTEQHRTDPTCANCHRVLDPIGFGLENFDAIGRWRDTDEGGGVIDAAGELPGGKRFATPRELKAILAAREADLARNLTEKLLAYALCRPLEGYDEIVVSRLMDTIARDGYRMQTLITEVVTSYPFTQRRIH